MCQIVSCSYFLKYLCSWLIYIKINMCLKAKISAKSFALLYFFSIFAKGKSSTSLLFNI